MKFFPIILANLKGLVMPKAATRPVGRAHLINLLEG